MNELDAKLFDAIRSKDLDLIAKLLSEGADVNCTEYSHLSWWSEPDHRDYTPLICAIENNNIEIVNYLLEHGAKIEPESVEANTPLLASVHFENPQIAELLLSLGADPNRKGPAIDHRGRESLWPPLYYATLYEMDDLVKVLLSYSVNLNERIDPHGDTALHRAVYIFSEPIARMLLEKGADFSVKDFSGRSPLDIAVFMYQLESRRGEWSDYDSFHEKQGYYALLALFREFGAKITSDGEAEN